MDRFFHHVLRGLVAVLGLVSTPLAAQSVITGFRARHVLFVFLALVGLTPNVYAQSGQTFTHPDEGEALAACLAALSGAVGLTYTEQTYHGPQPRLSIANPRACTERSNAHGHVNTSSADRYICANTWTDQAGNPLHERPCSAPQWLFPNSSVDTHIWTASCATRPNKATTWTGGDDVLVCERGCEYTNIGVGGVTACMWSGTAGNRSYACAGNVGTTGATCTGSGTAVAGGPPSDPDRDGDGTSNDSDDAPDDPGCSTGCGPQPPPPPPEEPPPPPEEPPPPDDGQDDGAQLAGELGPRLDAIEQAVLGLGPRFDGVRAAVEGARGDANADADGIRSALDGIRAAIVAQGPNAGPGEGDEPVDMSPLNPGNDGGEHPALGSIIEQGDAGQLLGQLDTDGFGFGRSCPAYAWPLSFDLGWANINIQQSVGIVCTALAILGFIIGLAGLIQASFILGRIGAT